MTSHRITDRRKPVRCGVLACVSGAAVTFQNNSLAWVALMDDLALANTECCILLRHSCQRPLVAQVGTSRSTFLYAKDRMGKAFLACYDLPTIGGSYGMGMLPGYEEQR